MRGMVHFENLNNFVSVSDKRLHRISGFGENFTPANTPKNNIARLATSDIKQTNSTTFYKVSIFFLFHICYQIK